jgi:hypothetical protein
MKIVNKKQDSYEERNQAVRLGNEIIVKNVQGQPYDKNSF